VKGKSDKYKKLSFDIPDRP